MLDACAFHAKPGPITDLSTVDPSLLTDLPADAAGLCEISAGLMVHEFLVHHYDVSTASGRLDELEHRAVKDLVAVITSHATSPLSQRRHPADRALGNCRQFTVLTCALLRRAGHLARARAGFADYFEAGRWVDHWIVERWDDQAGRWIRTDPQLDDVQRDVLGVEFDPLDLPTGKFLTGAEAWLRCREGQDDPDRFGIDDMHGE